MKERTFTTNIYLALIARLGIITFLFSVTRLLFYLFNSSYFQDTDNWDGLGVFLYGLKFDLSSIMLINLLFIAMQTVPLNIRFNQTYQKIAATIFYITNGIALMLNCIDLVFFRFIFRRTTWDVLKGSFIGDDFQTVLVQYIIDYWHASLIWISLFVVMIYLYRKTKSKFEPLITGIRQYIINTLWFLAAISLSIVIGRGGVQLRPISLVTAGEYAAPDNIPFLVNTPFSVISTLKKSSITEKKYFSPDEAREIFNPLIQTNTDNASQFRKLNIVVLIVESLSEEYIGKLNKEKNYPAYKGYTPFIDSLLDHSLYFTHSFANGKRSIEGIPAVVSGLPALMNEAYITSVFSGNKINSLPILLKKFGYTSSFFHGGKNGTMNFDAYTELAGFDNYYGKNEYNKDIDYDGEWGIFDEPFLQYAAKTLNASKQPFFAVLYTLSSHHPYSVPEKYKNKFSKGTLEIHESMGYTDHAIKRFFDTYSKMPSFDSTLFVITADHASISESEYYQNSLGAYAIPVIFYMHNSQLIGKSKTITQQSDIMPSVLGFLRFNEPYAAFGKNIFDSINPHFAVSLVNNKYQLVKDGYVLQFSNDKAIALYDLNKDLHLRNNLLTSNPAKAREMERFLKAYIQTYNERMIKNRLTATDE